MAFHIEDLASADDLGNDFRSLGNFAKTGLTPAYNFIKGLPGALSPQQADLSGVKEAQRRAFATQDQLAAERGGYRGYYNPVRDAMLSAQQAGGLSDLYSASHGLTPSVAELQLKNQAAQNAAGAYGTAAALQGRNPGMALRAANDAAFRTNSDANIQAAMLRAKEMSDARNAYMSALGGVRGQEQNLLGSDMDWRKALLQGQVGALGAGTTAAGAGATASANNAAANNAFKGGLINTGAQLLGSFL